MCEAIETAEPEILHVDRRMADLEDQLIGRKKTMAARGIEPRT